MRRRSASGRGSHREDGRITTRLRFGEARGDDTAGDMIGFPAPAVEDSAAGALVPGGAVTFRLEHGLPTWHIPVAIPLVPRHSYRPGTR
jgi:hypothetical protein